jgi:hypothetical protein
MTTSERDQVAAALQVAEERHAAAVAAHGVLLAEERDLANQLRQMVVAASGPELVQNVPLMFESSDLPPAMQSLVVRLTRLRGKDTLGELQQASAAADNLDKIVAKGRALLERLDAEPAE